MEGIDGEDFVVEKWEFIGMVWVIFDYVFNVIIWDVFVDLLY